MFMVERSCSEVGITPVPSVTFKNRNGGIPIFTQERIEERQRKVSVMINECARIVYYMECSTEEWLQQFNCSRNFFTTGDFICSCLLVHIYLEGMKLAEDWRGHFM